MNLASVIRDNARRHALKPAILFENSTFNYAELWHAIESIAAFLEKNGVARGSRVGLSMKEHPLHLISHYAVARLSALIVPMDHRWSESEKQSAAIAFATTVVLTDGDSIAAVDCLTLNEQVLQTSTNSLPPIDDNDTDVLISLSSGTTGKPKGALVTHQNLYERFVSQWHAIGYGSADCFVVLTPFYFGAGRSFGMSLLAAGGTVRIAPPPMTLANIVDVLSDQGSTAAFVPPTLLRRLFDLHRSGTPPLLANLNYLVASGEPLFAEEARICRQTICPNLYSYYASSEGGGISVLEPDDFADYATTVGKPMYRTDVEIVDSDDNVLPDGEVGRLRYRGPGVATRYLDSDGSKHDAGHGGWFYPGDLAEKLASGHIALRGRDKEVIIRGGVNVYPAEVEAAILEHPDVEEVAVIGRDDEAKGQLVAAFLVTRKSLADDDINAWCEDRLAPYKIPQVYVRLDVLPKRSSGKIDKKLLETT